MSRLIAVLGGFGATLFSFVAGALLATTYLVAEPVQKREQVDAAAIWPGEPVKVETPSDFERLPARPVSPAAPSTQVASAEDGDEPGVDMMTTAAVAADAPRQAAREARLAELGAAHLDWCESRYRSYRAGDNSYQPYSGGRRPCVSPHLEEMQALASGDPSTAIGAGEAFGPQDAEGGLIEAAVDDAGEEIAFAEEDPAYEVIEYGTAAFDARHAGADWDHVQSCFERYRSYRPEDNTYQPFGGGPRRQCQ